MPLVLVRTPTYRRPVLLRRALECLQAQTHQDWICEVRDDCPSGSAKEIVEDLDDRRIVYVKNNPQKFMIENLDACFARENPYGADYFFMLEDDNQVYPSYMCKGIEIIENMDVPLCMMNQVVENLDKAGADRYSKFGIFDGIYDERVHSPREIRLALFGWTAMSNGSIFWSKNIRRDLAFRTGTIPGIDEDLRAFRLVDPVYVCLDKLAVWAKDESATNRNLGFKHGKLRREIDMQASARYLRRAVWDDTPLAMKDGFLKGGVLKIPLSKRFSELMKSGISVPNAESSFEIKKEIKRRVVDVLGRPHASVVEAKRSLLSL